MDEVSIVGVDLAKHVFQVHGAAADGRVLFRKKLSRAQFARFMGDVRPCIVAMEACGTSHYWGRVMEQLGYEVRLIPPIYVKPFIKRQKNDVADAEAIAEAALRPTMRMVPVKSSAQQARGMLFRTRELLVGQRTQMINALRAHLAEHGIVVPKGLSNLERLAAITRTHEAELPELMREMTDVYLHQIARISDQIAALETRISEEAKRSTIVRRLRGMPGIGPICAMAIEAFSPPMAGFRRGRDFAAWLGLVPRQHSSGGKQKLGRTSKMGQRDIRRLLIIGAMSVVRWRSQNGSQPGSWLARMLARKPKMLVAIALANKMARAVWAMLTPEEDYQVPKGEVC